MAVLFVVNVLLVILSELQNVQYGIFEAKNLKRGDFLGFSKTKSKPSVPDSLLADSCLARILSAISLSFSSRGSILKFHFNSQFCQCIYMARYSSEMIEYLQLFVA